MRRFSFTVGSVLLARPYHGLKHFPHKDRESDAAHKVDRTGECHTGRAARVASVALYLLGVAVAIIGPATASATEPLEVYQFAQVNPDQQLEKRQLLAIVECKRHCVMMTIICQMAKTSDDPNCAQEQRSCDARCAPASENRPSEAMPNTQNNSKQEEDQRRAYATRSYEQCMSHCSNMGIVCRTGSDGSAYTPSPLQCDTKFHACEADCAATLKRQW